MRRIAVIAALAAGALGLSGCATPPVDGFGAEPVGGAPRATSLPAPEFGAGAPGVLSGEVAKGVMAVRAYAPTAYPDVYAGLGSGTPESVDRLVIYLSGATTAIEADLLAVSGVQDPAKVVFRTAWLAVADSAALDARVGAAVPGLRDEGIQIQDYGVGVDGAEEIGVHDLTEAQTTRLFDLFGPYLRLREVRANTFGEYPTPAA